MKDTKSGNYLIAEQKAQIIPQEFDKTFNQAFLHLKMMSEEILNSIQEKDASKKEKITLMDDLINETSNFCVRILSEVGYKEYEKSIFVFSLVEKIEQMGDSYRDIYYHYVKNPSLFASQKGMKTLLEIFAQVNELIDQLYHVHCKFTVERINKCAVSCQEIFSRIQEIADRKSNPADFKTLFLLYDVVSKVWDSLEALMAINHEEIIEKEQ
jgi:Na+/phosphate symporter